MTRVILGQAGLGREAPRQDRPPGTDENARVTDRAVSSSLPPDVIDYEVSDGPPASRRLAGSELWRDDYRFLSGDDTQFHAGGSLPITPTWPTMLPENFELYMQYWLLQPGVANGVAASKALLAVGQ